MECLTNRNQWFEDGCYIRQEELTFADSDCQGRLRPSTLLSLCVSAASFHFENRGIAYGYLRREYHGVMLLSRIVLRVHRYPRLGKLYNVRTWMEGIHGVRFSRNFEISSQDTLWVSGRSEWIFVNPDSRKILRPEVLSGVHAECSLRAVDCPACRKLSMPDGLTKLGSRTIGWSDLDCNGHLFSGNYGDIIWDYLPPELQNRTLSELHLNYLREATLGQTLDLKGVRNDNVYWMEAREPHGVCFMAECTFADEGGA